MKMYNLALIVFLGWNMQAHANGCGGNIFPFGFVGILSSNVAQISSEQVARKCTATSFSNHKDDCGMDLLFEEFVDQSDECKSLRSQVWSTSVSQAEQSKANLEALFKDLQSKPIVIPDIDLSKTN